MLELYCATRCREDLAGLALAGGGEVMASAVLDP